MENGKIRVIVDNPIKVLSSIQIAYSAVGRRQPNRSAYYIGYFYCVNNLLTSKLKVISNGVVPNGGGTEIGTSIVNTLPCPAGSITAELEIVSLNSTTSQLTWTLYNSGNVAFAVVSGTDTTLSLQTTGQWGTWGF
ncbi:MAG: hypothetical protein LBP53_02235 [Candidatus Peribacteria bacterium]|jgi:hypothetical protein|nr:hypothetical protein [Candidatus Peribacteria bacterium]